jgi:Beta-lactamase enzyme family
MPPNPRSPAPNRPVGHVHAAVPCVHLAFLPHLVDLLGVHGLSNLDPQLFAPPAGFLTANGVHRDQPLQDIVDRMLRRNPDLSELRFALVDLTDPSPNPGPSKLEVKNIHGSLVLPQIAGIAGKDLTKQGDLASIDKLSCMWAAFQLKFDVETLAKQVGINDKDQLFNQGGACRKLWDLRQKNSTNVTVLNQANPKIELHGNLIFIDGKPVCLPHGADYPDQYRIFNVTPGAGGAASLSFIGLPSGAQTTPVSAAAKRYEKHGPKTETEARKLTFWDRMLLMIDASDNACAGTCIENVGFLYIASVLWQSGLFSPSRGGGLWLGGNYNALQWIKAPVPKNDPVNDFITGTAASVAALVTALVQDRLVSKDSCAAMKFLMDTKRRDRFLSSFFLDGLRAQHIHIDKCYSKVGVGTRDHDCVFIERTVQPSGRKIRYVAAGFDSDTDTALHDLILQLDSCILENNGLGGPVAP